MAVVRRNILTNAASRRAFVQGVLALKQELPGPTSRDVGIAGSPAVKLSTYDLFVVWHFRAMNTFTPPTQTDRNAAHRGPVFLPWHRFMLLLLEQHLQRVLGNPAFGLPYWDWAADGDKPSSGQRASKLWSSTTGIGGTGSPVTDGPFAFDAANPTGFRVRVVQNLFTGRLELVNRGLRRQLGEDPGAPTLPTARQVSQALALATYDRSPWSTASPGLRNRLEGWGSPSGPRLHNRVHVWVGGDMGPGTSPNDPVFFLNHCNVDRIWQAWMPDHGNTYAPDATAPASLAGHRIGDTLSSMLTTDQPKLEAMFDVATIYRYDRLPSA